MGAWEGLSNNSRTTSSSTGNVAGTNRSLCSGPPNFLINSTTQMAWWCPAKHSNAHHNEEQGPVPRSLFSTTEAALGYL